MKVRFKVVNFNFNFSDLINQDFQLIF